MNENVNEVCFSFSVCSFEGGRNFSSTLDPLQTFTKFWRFSVRNRLLVSKQLFDSLSWKWDLFIYSYLNSLRLNLVHENIRRHWDGIDTRFIVFDVKQVKDCISFSLKSFLLSLLRIFFFMYYASCFSSLDLICSRRCWDSYFQLYRKEKDYQHENSIWQKSWSGSHSSWRHLTIWEIDISPVSVILFVMSLFFYFLLLINYWHWNIVWIWTRKTYRNIGS